MLTDGKLIAFRRNEHTHCLILWSEGIHEDSEFMEDLTFEDGELEIPGTGLWVWDGEYRIEPAQWYGPHWSEGGAYLYPEFGNEDQKYRSEWRRPTIEELSRLAQPGD